MEQGTPVNLRWSLIFTLIGAVLWSQPGISAKFERFTDKEGTLHIFNESQPESGKPGGIQAPDPVEMSPPLPMFAPPASLTEPPERSGNGAPPPEPESGGEAQAAPVPPPQVAPGQQE
jgi:hypothetical protein